MSIYTSTEVASGVQRPKLFQSCQLSENNYLLILESCLCCLLFVDRFFFVLLIPFLKICDEKEPLYHFFAQRVTNRLQQSQQTM